MNQFINISNFTNKQAREYLESVRWSKGVICPHCNSKKSFKLTAKKGSKKPVRDGVYKCSSCRKQFSVTVGTIFENSHISLNKWLIAIYLICSSKKGISSNQLHRMLDITYKSAWFMSHRIRYAMEQNNKGYLSGTVEVDETYIGGFKSGTTGRGSENKTPVVALIQRNGEVRSKQIDKLTSKNLKAYIRENVDKDSTIITDEFRSYNGLNKEFKDHQTVNHSKKEYVRGDVYTNTVEGYFSLLKRGINGTFHHISKKHLQRYLAEFDFRYNHRILKDETIASILIENSKGKRLTYRGTN